MKSFIFSFFLSKNSNLKQHWAEMKLLTVYTQVCLVFIIHWQFLWNLSRRLQIWINSEERSVFHGLFAFFGGGGKDGGSFISIQLSINEKQKISICPDRQLNINMSPYSTMVGEGREAGCIETANGHDTPTMLLETDPNGHTDWQIPLSICYGTAHLILISILILSYESLCPCSQLYCNYYVFLCITRMSQNLMLCHV